MCPCRTTVSTSFTFCACPTTIAVTPRGSCTVTYNSSNSRNACKLQPQSLWNAAIAHGSCDLAPAPITTALPAVCFVVRTRILSAIGGRDDPSLQHCTYSTYIQYEMLYLYCRGRVGEPDAWASSAVVERPRHFIWKTDHGMEESCALFCYSALAWGQ